MTEIEQAIRERAHEIYLYRLENPCGVCYRNGDCEKCDWENAEFQVRQFCLGGCGRLLTVEQKNNPDISKLRCDFCRPIGIKHAQEFPKLVKELGEGEG